MAGWLWGKALLGGLGGFLGSAMTASTAECYRSIEDPVLSRQGKAVKRVKTFSQRYQNYVLGDIIPVTHDVALFRFLLRNENDEFNLRPCSTLQACFKHGAQSVEQCHRFYTPVTANHTKGYFDIIVKRKNEGKMTSHLFGLHVGDQMLFRCVVMKIQYKPNRWKDIGMIAGGTGFTPMLQVIRHALCDPLEKDVVDNTKLSFLYCNRTESDVLLKGLFDKLALEYPERFRVRYTVDNAVSPQNWDGDVGYVTEEMVKETMPDPKDPNSIVLVCGPDALLRRVAGTQMGLLHTMSSGLAEQPIAADINNISSLAGILGDLKYDNERVYRF